MTTPNHLASSQNTEAPGFFSKVGTAISSPFRAEADRNLFNTRPIFSNVVVGVTTVAVVASAPIVVRGIANAARGGFGRVAERTASATVSKTGQKAAASFVSGTVSRFFK